MMAQGALLIMAGGRSERMKVPKSFLRIDGMSFMEKIAMDYSLFGIKEMVAVLNDRFLRYVPPGMVVPKVVTNHFPECGRFYSLQIGLKELSDSDFVFIHNVDNPFVEKEVLQEMWLKKEEDSFVVPMYDEKGGHPVLLSRKIVNDIVSVKNANGTLRDVLKDYKRIEVETDSERILVNINTWEDYENQILNLTTENCGDGYL